MPVKCADDCVHYNDVIMGAIASQITSLTTVYSTVYSDADQRKHQSFASLAFREIHLGPVNSPHKWPVMRKCFHLMTSSCVVFCYGYIFCPSMHVNHIHLPMSFRTHRQLLYFPSASETTINDMGETTVTKNIQYNKVRTAGIFVGMCCSRDEKTLPV